MRTLLKCIPVLVLMTNCATYDTHVVEQVSATDGPMDKELLHSFYLIGDAGMSPDGDLNPTLKKFKDRLSQAPENSTAVFLGDNIYPKGMPKKSDPSYGTAKHYLDAQLATLENYKGQPLFLPGNHDWYNNGPKGVERQRDYIVKALDDKNAFFPKNGCPLKKIEISDKLVVLAVDTQWFLANWDHYPTMNDDCEIKNREKFFQEFEGLIKKNLDKTTVVAMHHPMFTYGPHGGQFSLGQQLFPSPNFKFPLPVLGSLANILRKTTGASPQDLNNKRYRELRKRLVTLSQFSEKVIFVSGHEHSLQYIVEENIPQIVSGAGAKRTPVRSVNGSRFSAGQNGYAVLNVYGDGSSNVTFFGVDKAGAEKDLFATEVLSSDVPYDVSNYPEDFPPVVKASVYPKETVDKSGFYKTLWGERYSKYYGIEVEVPTVRLDTLFGGLTPIRKGGGHQSRSVRLEDKEGRQYVMRAIKKSAEVYLQAEVFKDQYVIGEYGDTATEDLLYYIYTGSNPYAPFVVGTLSDAVGVYHTNPVLYYVPKQKALGGFNEEFGDELYMIEERTDSGHGDKESFGFSNTMISTDDLIKKLHKDEKFMIDTDHHVRSRIFDMWMGDWDRHTDQWRWAEFKEDGEVIYRGVPRDRDQVFTRMADGALMGFGSYTVPALRRMRVFTSEIKDVRGLMSSPKAFALDLALLPQTTLEAWEEQAKYIQDHMSAEVIDAAFAHFPEEIRDETIEGIKQALLIRKDDLVNYAREYYEIISKKSIVTGTNKDDYFTVTSLPNGNRLVIGQRIKGGEKADVFFKKEYDRDLTKEVWLYGLDDEDVFEVTGKSPIKVRLIGGQNNDTYKVDGNKVYVYDFKDKKNDYSQAKKARRIRRTRDYETNIYNLEELHYNTNQFIPSIGANPDDGLRIGFSNIYTVNGIERNPVPAQHILNGAFYFATQGFDLRYRGEFSNVIGHTNLQLKAAFTSPNFAMNFFGFGNETPNFDDDLDLDYNRVKLRTLRFSPALLWRGRFGSRFTIGATYESIEIGDTDDRFVDQFIQDSNIDVENTFIGGDMEYSFDNRDNAAFPTLGMTTALKAGYRSSTNDNGKSFGYVTPSLGIAHKLVPNGRLVLATKWKAHFNLGDDYEFYQAASIGGTDGLRGYRNQRFAGKTSYYQNTDLRYSFRKMRTGLVPTAVGLFGGFDYGRVWLPNEDSDEWHTSYGGGFFLNATDVFSMNLSAFNSDDGMRFVFGLGFGF